MSFVFLVAEEIEYAEAESMVPELLPVLGFCLLSSGAVVCTTRFNSFARCK
jgi:hypothetical protein